jgi:pyruvate/2-oxoglutarate dehydrogenase complex dihydrolipoamide acyltransferase (E2) component
VVKNEQILIRDVMKMTLTADHRIIDGAIAARFMNTLKSKLKETALWKSLV